MTWLEASDISRLYVLAQSFPEYEQGGVHLQALSLKRAWYQHMPMRTGRQDGDWFQRNDWGEGKRGRDVCRDVEKEETVSFSHETSARNSSTLFDSWGFSTAVIDAGAAIMILSASCAISLSDYFF